MNKTVLTEKDHLDIKKLRGKLSVKNIQKKYKIGVERIYRIFNNTESPGEIEEEKYKKMVEEADGGDRS